MQKYYRQYEERSCSICGEPFTTRKDNKARMCSRKCYGKYLSTRMTVEERFMSKVQKTEQCWLWIGKKAKGGYGSFSANGKSYIAHRFYYSLINGHIPDDIKACHKCDNPPCVNPDHIFLGTQSENLQDAVQKGRRRTRGEDNGFSKLTTQQVIEIRRSYSSGSMIKAEIARKFNTSKTNVTRIINRESWTHI